MNKPETIKISTVRLIPVGNSTGLVLPKEVLARLRVGRGDEIFLTESADGSLRLTPYDPEFGRQMEQAETIMREDRDILRRLAE